MKKITFLVGALLLTIFINAQCNAPTKVHIVIEWYDIFIQWDDNGESLWDIEFGETGFVPTGIPSTEDLPNSYINLAYNNPFELNTNIDLYVRADCGTEQSDWIGPFTFHNYCLYPEVYEYFEDEFLPLCWEQANQGSPDTEPFGFGQGIWEQSNFANGSSNLSAKIHIQGTEVNEWLLTPLLEALIPVREETYWINYDFTIALTLHNSLDEAVLGSDDKIELVYSLDYGKTWQNLHYWDSNSSISNTGETVNDYITVYTDSLWLLIAFWVSSGVVNDTEDVDFFIDNVNFYYFGSGSVTDLASKGFAYYPNPSENTINLSAKETINQVVLYNSLGQKVKSVLIDNLNHHLDISELPESIYYMHVKIGDTIGVVSVVKN